MKTMDDLISRQAAKNKKVYSEERHEYVIPVAEIDWLPPVQPEPKWILCRERLPEEHEWMGTKKFGTTISDEVYVTFENPKGERFCKHLSFQNGKLSGFDQSTIDAFYKGSKPIAWMPLPEPWRGEANEGTVHQDGTDPEGQTEVLRRARGDA